MPYTIQEVKKALLCCARVLEEKKERLTENAGPESVCTKQPGR